MTRREAKRRLRFMAEWWSPEVLRWSEQGGDGCLLEATADAGCTTDAVKRLGLGSYSPDVQAITTAWDSRDHAAALAAIERL